MTPKSPPDITVFHIADWFLAKANDESVPLSHMKLQKLVYFAYGWYCAFRDYSSPLFSDSILVWRRGVIVKALYNRFNAFGDEPIVAEVGYPDLSVEVTEILEDVWKGYSPLSDSLLDSAIRRHSAWRKAQRSLEWDAVMSPESIRETFKKLIEQYEHAH